MNNNKPFVRGNFEQATWLTERIMQHIVTGKAKRVRDYLEFARRQLQVSEIPADNKLKVSSLKVIGIHEDVLELAIELLKSEGWKAGNVSQEDFLNGSPWLLDAKMQEDLLKKAEKDEEKKSESIGSIFLFVKANQVVLDKTTIYRAECVAEDIVLQSKMRSCIGLTVEEIEDRGGFLAEAMHDLQGKMLTKTFNFLKSFDDNELSTAQRDKLLGIILGNTVAHLDAIIPGCGEAFEASSSAKVQALVKTGSKR
jgi:hypothetical protein